MDPCAHVHVHCVRYRGMPFGYFVISTETYLLTYLPTYLLTYRGMLAFGYFVISTEMLRIGWPLFFAS